MMFCNKIYIVLRAKARRCSHKNSGIKQMDLLNSLDPRYNLLLVMAYQIWQCM